MFCPGGDEQLPGVPGADAQQLGHARRRPGHERLMLFVEFGDLPVELLDAPCK